jgi:hypothetical protein
MVRRLGITSRQSSCGVRISLSPSSAISVFRRATTSPPRNGRTKAKPGVRAVTVRVTSASRGRVLPAGAFHNASSSRATAPVARSSAAPVASMVATVVASQCEPASTSMAVQRRSGSVKAA